MSLQARIHSLLKYLRQIFLRKQLTAQPLTIFAYKSILDI